MARKTGRQCCSKNSNHRQRDVVAGIQASEASDAVPAAVSDNGGTKNSSSRWSWTSTHDKDILALALPAALALAADPLLGMVDTALVGRLGADELVSRLALRCRSSMIVLLHARVVGTAMTGIQRHCCPCLAAVSVSVW